MTQDTIRDAREPGFYMIDNELIDNYGPVIGAYGVAVYNVLARYANKHGEKAFPSYNHIAEKLAFSRDTAIRTVKQLVDYGLVRKEQRLTKAGDMTSNEYILVHIKGSSPQQPPSSPQQPPSSPQQPPSSPQQPYKELLRNTSKKDKSKEVGDPRLQDLPASKQSQTPPPTASPEEQERPVPVQQQQARDESAKIRAYANSLRSSIAKPTGDPLVDAAAAKFNGDRGYVEKRTCDVHTQRAEKIGLPPVMFRSMVDCLLDATKKRAAVDNFSDERSSRTLAEHKEVILALAEAFPSYRTATDVQTIVDAFFAEKKYKDIHVGQYRDYAADWLTRKPKVSPQAQREADEAADLAWAKAGGVLEDVGEMYKPAPVKPEFNMRRDPITLRLVPKDAPLGS